jgi:hypothetical protein
LKVLVTELPLESRAVQLTDVFPTGKTDPDGGLQLTDGLGSTVSVAVAENATTTPAGSAVLVVMLPGMVSVGGVVSTTRTRNVAEALLPEESVAVQVTGVVRIWNWDPDGGLHTTVGFGSTRSVAVTE